MIQVERDAALKAAMDYHNHLCEGHNPCYKCQALAALFIRFAQAARIEALKWAQPHAQPCACLECERIKAEIARLTAV